MASRPLFQDLDEFEKSYDGKNALRLEVASLSKSTKPACATRDRVTEFELERDSHYYDHESIRTTSATGSRTLCVPKSSTHQDCAGNENIRWETHAVIQSLAGEIKELETRYGKVSQEMEQLRTYLTENVACVKAENRILTEAFATAGRTKEVMQQEIENLKAQYDTLQETSDGFERGQAVLQQESDALKDEMTKLRKRKRPWWRRSKACKLQSRH